MRFSFGFAVVVLIFAAGLQAQVTTTHGELKLVHAKAAQTSARPRMTIVEPRENEIVPGPDVTVNFRLQNWKPEKDGNHLHFLLDENPFVPHYSSDAIVFHNVAPGPHVIFAFPVFPWHESVKQQEAMAMVQFYVKEKSEPLPLDASMPLMIYSTPVGVHDSNEQAAGQPHPGILIDWFLHNVTMGSRTGYFVRISVDGNALTTMKEWRPHYIQKLRAGDHKIKLELLRNGVPVRDNWNNTERTITVR
jgi:hypothetical protein